MGGGAGLSQDLIEYGILPRLPAKALLRLQCVSRRWHTLIASDPYFIHLQCRSAQSGLLLLDDGEEELISDDPRSIGIPSSWIQIEVERGYSVAYCNGLVCLLCYDKNFVPKLYVGNPSLRDWKLIPDSNSGFSNERFGLAVDVGESGGVCYKLVVLGFTKDEDETRPKYSKFACFSSTTGLWEVSKQRADFTGTNHSLDYAAYVNGILYWRCFDRLLWFDCKGDRCGFHPLPPPDRSSEWPGLGLVVEWNDELRYYRISQMKKIDIWSMDKCNWVKKFSFSLAKIFNRNPEVFASPELGISIGPMPFWNDTTILFYLIREQRRPIMIYSYNMETGEVRKQFETLFPTVLFSYKNTLVPSPNIKINS